MVDARLATHGHTEIACPAHGTWVMPIKEAYAHAVGGYFLCPRCLAEVDAGTRLAKEVCAITPVTHAGRVEKDEDAE